ncbi:MAG: lytic murein transglycosylase [Desulfobulbaceae bacterium]|nr:lytic murein transglycosylase [Desulfobulbaceae bacterium]
MFLKILDHTYDYWILFTSTVISKAKLLALLLTLHFLFCNPILVSASPTTTAVTAADLVVDRQPIDIQSTRYQLFFKELIETHHFKREKLTTLFYGVQIDKKVLQLMDKQWEAKPYYQYWPRFITPSVIKRGKRSLIKFRPLFDRIEDDFGVNREVIVAIWAIESRFGANTGHFNLFRTLNTLFDAYPRRSDFFRKELLHFLLLCKANDIDPLTITGSYAGAFGQAQFMPSSFNAYAVDGDGDSKKDLIDSMPDVFGSIANYLQAFGWILNSPVFEEIGNDLHSVKLIQTYNKGRKGRIDWRYLATTQQVAIPRPPGNSELSVVGLQLGPDKDSKIRYVAGYPNFHAITYYNHSHKYAMAVAELAAAFAK